MLESPASPVRNTLAFEASVCGGAFTAGRRHLCLCSCSCLLPACWAHVLDFAARHVPCAVYCMYWPKGSAILFSASYPKKNSLYPLPIGEGGWVIQISLEFYSDCWGWEHLQSHELLNQFLNGRWMLACPRSMLPLGASAAPVWVLCGSLLRLCLHSHRHEAPLRHLGTLRGW